MGQQAHFQPKPGFIQLNSIFVQISNLFFLPPTNGILLSDSQFNCKHILKIKFKRKKQVATIIPN